MRGTAAEGGRGSTRNPATLDRLCGSSHFPSCIAPSALESAPMSGRPSLIARREFLRFVAASPYVAAVGGMGSFFQNGPAAATELTTADAALNVFDFEE